MKKWLFFLILFFFSFLFKKTEIGSSGISDYCYVPPSVVGTQVKPNILLVVDFSGSMQFPAYVPCNFNGYTSQKVAQCGSNNSQYDPTKTYSGYFDSNKCYQYSSSFFIENTSCDCSNKVGSSNCISGNLLNWITTTRIDAARAILTGGRTSQSGGNTFLESEGATYTITDSNLKCRFTIGATQTSQRKLTILNYNGACPLGNNIIYNALIKLRPSDPSSVQGVIHRFCDVSDLNGQINEKCQAIFYFMVFAGDGREGEIRTGKTATISSLINAINTELPYWGTPTGEALWEAWDFFKQNNTHTYEVNTPYINPQNGNVDPYYDGSGGNSRPIPCRKSFVLLLSDGAWNGGVDPVVPAREMNIRDLRADLPGRQNVVSYVIYAFGDEDVQTRLQGKQASISTAIFGGFEDIDGNNYPYPFTSIQYPNGYGTCSSLQGTIRSNLKTESQTYCNSRGVSYPLAQCNPDSTWDSRCGEWDTLYGSSRDGLPYNFYFAEDPDELKSAIIRAILDILKRASSGATVATLTQKVGSGSVLVQPYFLANYQSELGEINWIGSLKGLWLDFLARIREDTNNNRILEILGDIIDRWIIFATKKSTGDSVAFEIFNGTTCSYNEKGIFEVKTLFDVGCKLAERNYTDRTIYVNLEGALTSLDPDNFNLVNFLTNLWNQTAQVFWNNLSINTNTTKCIINYLRGEGTFSCIGGDSSFIARSREINLSQLCGNNINTTWKLGDIIFSTPTIISNQPLNSYHLRYGDQSYFQYINSENYKNRTSFILVGANDGMLHAFRLGWLSPYQPPNKPLRLIDAFNTETTNLIGKEEWAFIPYNVLPYLVAYGHKDYCHIFTTDYKVLVFDAKIDNTWKTLLLGVMGLGGRQLSLSNGVFSSSIFLLDLTPWLEGRQNYPDLLWERTLPDKTLTTSYPQVIKIGDNWYVFIGSGPQYVFGSGQSTLIAYPSQPKIYIFTLKEGNLVKDFSIPNVSNQAVGMLRAIDYNNDYSDDFIYFGTYSSSSGKFYRLNLRLSNGSYVNISDLSSSHLIQPLLGFPEKPVLASPEITLDPEKNLWVIFGTGTYFGNDITQTDQYFIGFKDRCLWEGGCTSWDDLLNRTNYCNLTTNYNATLLYTSAKRTCIYNETSETIVPVEEGAVYLYFYDKTLYGWYHKLDTYERIYSTPFIIGDLVQALSFKPNEDICLYGGVTNLFTICYREGCPCLGPGETPQGKKELALGSPPWGQPFQIVTLPDNKVAILTQTSYTPPILTGPPMKLPALEGKFILWIEK